MIQGLEDISPFVVVGENLNVYFPHELSDFTGLLDGTGEDVYEPLFDGLDTFRFNASGASMMRLVSLLAGTLVRPPSANSNSTNALNDISLPLILSDKALLKSFSSMSGDLHCCNDCPVPEMAPQRLDRRAEPFPPEL